jgi:hypothetical protein
MGGIVVMHFRRAHEGYILAWVLVVVLILACAGMTIMEMSRNESALVSRDEKYLKALNLAESGVDFALYRMKGEIGWTGNTGTQKLTDDQSFAATVAALPQPQWYRITSVGSAGRFSKTVTLDVQVKPHGPWPDAFEYALFWGNPSSAGTSVLLRNNMQVEGNVFGYGGFTLENNAVIDGTLAATGTITGGGTAQIIPAPQPPPERATLNTSTYDGLIKEALEKPNAPADWRIDNGNRYTLPNGLWLVRGNAYVDTNAILYGPGKLVASGDIIISNGASVLENASLIAGGRVVFLNNSRMEGTAGCVIFARSLVEFNNNADVTSKVAVLSPGTIKLYNNGMFNGIVFGSSVLCSNNARVTGAVYADTFVCDQVLNNFEVIYDPTLLDMPLPDGIDRSKVVATFKLGQWDEQAVVVASAK